LGQGQAAHHMPSSYRETGIGPNQKYAWFHRFQLKLHPNEVTPNACS
jgi:hypothetical protein